MLDYSVPRMEDKLFIESVFKKSKCMGCVYSFALMMAWQSRYHSRFCAVGDALIIRGGDPGHEYYLYPVGDYDIKEIIPMMLEDAHDRGIPFFICCAEPWQKEEIEEAFPGRFVIEPERDDFDYIYNVSDLAELKGRKYQSKRNHISKFTREYPDWTFEEITKENIEECRQAAAKWFTSGMTDLSEEEALDIIFDNFDYFSQKGGAIRADGMIVALTIGEKISDEVFVEHFEKAIPGYEEAYAVTNREFVRHFLGDMKYVNREEDMGLEGLRRSKLSYHPEILLEKYNITEADE